MKTYLLKRVILAMSLNLFSGIIFSCAFAGVLLVKEGKAQNNSLNKVFISVNLHQVTLKEALDVIEEKTSFKFIYEKSILSQAREVRVTLKSENKSAAFILKKIANETGFTFKNNDGVIGVNLGTPAKIPRTKEGGGRLFDKIVTGKVTDENGTPLAGANVIVKGTTIGTTTDIDGKYGLSVPEEATILVFSYIGYVTEEVEIAGRSVIDMTMLPDVTALKEITVSTGYWEVEEKLNPGNIAKVTAEDIENQPVSNPLQAIQGRMPGVNIRQNTGLPGSGFTIQIRGQNSLRNSVNDNGNLPFYVVDGVPFPAQPITTTRFGSVINFGNPLNSLNPADIESIEILKDADATAIYGSRGANGVVLITTKKGKVGEIGTNIDFNFSRGFGEISNKAELLNTQQYLEMRNEAFANDEVEPDPNNLNHNDVTSWGDGYTDWQEVLIGGTADYTNAQASISGGDGNTRFTFAAGYYKETTVYPGDFAYEKGSGRFSLEHYSRDRRFNLNLSTNLVLDQNNISGTDPTREALRLAPNHPDLVDEDGNFFWGEEPNFSARNPLAELSRGYELKTFNVINNLRLGYRLFDNLTFETLVGYNRIQSDELRARPLSAYNTAFLAFGFTNSAVFSTTDINSLIIEPQLKYSKTISKGKLSFLLGSTFQRSTSEKESTSASGITDESSIENIAAADEIRNSEYLYDEYQYNAGYIRINFNWDDKYVINLTGRRDGSSRFGPDNRFGNFGAIGAAWVFSNEGFVKDNLSFLSFGKLRVSYGITGSDQIPNYQYLDTYEFDGRSYLNTPGLNPTRIANPVFSWETNRKLEGGLELGLVKDRFFLSTSYYRNRSSNQLVGFDLPATTGFLSFQNNLPAVVENTGWEFELKSNNFRLGDFQWSTSANLTILRNKLVEYANIENSPFATKYEVGKPLFVRYVYQYEEVDPETGVYTFQDLNEDGEIRSGDDRGFDAAGFQDFFGGFQNTFRYKGFELDIFFQFVKQTGRDYLFSFAAPGQPNENQPTEVLNRWRNPSDVTYIQRFTQGFTPARSAYSLAVQGDNGVVDASFIRLKNVSLSYALTGAVTDKLRLDLLKIYIEGQNLLTFTDYIGIDPESTALSLPPLRVLTAGIQVRL